MEFENKGVLITGAAGRIGREVALEFAREGAKVALMDLDPRKLQTALGLIRQGGGEAIGLPGDVAKKDDVQRAVDDAVSNMGGIDCLVNCAGIWPNTPVVEMPEEEWDRVYGVNLKGPMLTCQAVARHMITAGLGGSIVNISSGAAESARTGASHYCGSKAAVQMLSRVLAIELAPNNIRVNVVAPGLVSDQAIQKPAPPETRAYTRALLDMIPLGRTGTPADIAPMVIFLASDKARWITGEVFRVNGGSTSGRTTAPPSRGELETGRETI